MALVGQICSLFTEIASMTVTIDLSKPELRPNVITFNTDDANIKWLTGMETETLLSRSLLMHRILTQARMNVGIATIEGERRQRGERRSA
jgi:hypothetical protein